MGYHGERQSCFTPAAWQSVYSNIHCQCPNPTGFKDTYTEILHRNFLVCEPWQQCPVLAAVLKSNSHLQFGVVVEPAQCSRCQAGCSGAISLFQSFFYQCNSLKVVFFPVPAKKTPKHCYCPWDL